jgi:hypothetical protein
MIWESLADVARLLLAIAIAGFGTVLGLKVKRALDRKTQ